MLYISWYWAFCSQTKSNFAIPVDLSQFKSNHNNKTWPTAEASQHVQIVSNKIPI